MKNVCSQTQENFEKLKKAKVILLDLDGTVYIDYEPIDGVIASLERLRASGRKLVYLTNNSSKSYKDYEKNLRLSGIFESGDEIYTSAINPGNGSHEIFIGYQMDLNLQKKGKNMHKSVRVL